MNGIFAALLCLVSFSVAAQGAEIYRWVDQSGGVHYSDSLPKSPARQVRKLESLEFDPQVNTVPWPNTQEAQRSATGPNRNVFPDRGGSMAGASSAGASQSSSNQTDCTSMYARYMASQACFNRYRNVNGSLKQEAFEVCEEVKNPAIQCGPLVISPN